MGDSSVRDRKAPENDNGAQNDDEFQAVTARLRRRISLDSLVTNPPSPQRKTSGPLRRQSIRKQPSATFVIDGVKIETNSDSTIINIAFDEPKGDPSKHADNNSDIRRIACHPDKQRAARNSIRIINGKTGETIYNSGSATSLSQRQQNSAVPYRPPSSTPRGPPRQHPPVDYFLSSGLYSYDSLATGFRDDTPEHRRFQRREYAPQRPINYPEPSLARPSDMWDVTSAPHRQLGPLNTQRHGTQEWAPMLLPSRKGIEQWKRIQLLFNGFNGKPILVPNGLKDSGCSVGNLISFRLLRELGLMSLLDRKLEGKTVITGGGAVSLMGSVWLPWVEDPQGRQKIHEETWFHVWECRDSSNDIIMGDEWCMRNNALSTSQESLGENYAIRWADKEKPEESRTSRRHDAWQAQEASLAEAEAAEARNRRHRRLQHSRSSSSLEPGSRAQRQPLGLPSPTQPPPLAYGPAYSPYPAPFGAQPYAPSPYATQLHCHPGYPVHQGPAYFPPPTLASAPSQRAARRAARNETRSQDTGAAMLEILVNISKWATADDSRTPAEMAGMKKSCGELLQQITDEVELEAQLAKLSTKTGPEVIEALRKIMKQPELEIT